MEVDGGDEAVQVSIVGGTSFEGHDFAVEPLGDGVGDVMAAVVHDVVQAFADHLRDLFGTRKGGRNSLFRTKKKAASTASPSLILSAKPLVIDSLRCSTHACRPSPNVWPVEVIFLSPRG